MNGESTTAKTSAARVVASVFGALAGVGGLTHGIGETLQGNVTPSGMFIDSWTQGPIATNMGGDPAMTVVPNLLITGVLTIVISLATIVWAVGFVHREHGGAILILLSVGMLLVGGGFGSPIIGILAGIAGTSINAPLTWWRTRLSVSFRGFLARLWPWVLSVSVVDSVFLFVGALILVYGFGWGNEDLYLSSFFFAVVSLVLTILTGMAYDARRTELAHAAQ